MRVWLSALLGALLLGSPAGVWAKSLRAGDLWGYAAISPGLKIADDLGGSAGYFLIDSGLEFALSRNITLVGSITYGLANTRPLRLRAGARYRFTPPDWWLAPYAQAQLSVGKLYDVLGADPKIWGIRTGGGVEYFLTGWAAVGGQFMVDLGSTIGEKPALYGTTEVLAYGSFRFM